MKKILVLLLLVFSAFISNAQLTCPPVWDANNFTVETIGSYPYTRYAVHVTKLPGAIMYQGICMPQRIATSTDCQWMWAQQTATYASKATVGTSDTTIYFASGFQFYPGDTMLVGVMGTNGSTMCFSTTIKIKAQGTTTLCQTLGCGTICSAPQSVSVSANSQYFALATSWNRTPCKWLSFFVNGQIYKDGNSGYDKFSSAVTGIMLEFRVIGDTLPAGHTFNVKVRAYCDDTFTTFFDSPDVLYTVPSTFVNASAPTPVVSPTNTVKKRGNSAK